MIGLKSRENYEVPGAKLLIAAHQALEELVLTTDELRFAEYMSTLYADLVYRALWQEPLREDLDQAIDNMQERVSGEVVMKLGFSASLLIGGYLFKCVRKDRKVREMNIQMGHFEMFFIHYRPIGQ